MLTLCSLTVCVQSILLVVLVAWMAASLVHAQCQGCNDNGDCCTCDEGNCSNASGANAPTCECSNNGLHLTQTHVNAAHHVVAISFDTEPDTSCLEALSADKCDPQFCTVLTIRPASCVQSNTTGPEIQLCVPQTVCSPSSIPSFAATSSNLLCANETNVLAMFNIDEQPLELCFTPTCVPTGWVGNGDMCVASTDKAAVWAYLDGEGVVHFVGLD
jgi:hypothetical protein